MPNRDPFDLCGATIDGKYRVLSVVAHGGFGVVYKAVHEGFAAPVAVKCLKLPHQFDLAAQEALLQRTARRGDCCCDCRSARPGSSRRSTSDRSPRPAAPASPN